jgi:hypothetical protein
MKTTQEYMDENMKTTQEHLDETWQIIQQNKNTLAAIKYNLEYKSWPKDWEGASLKIIGKKVKEDKHERK